MKFSQNNLTTIQVTPEQVEFALKDCATLPVYWDSKRCATKAFAIDEKNLFKCNDTQDLADKIDYWIEHPEERKQRSKEYLSYTKQFNQTECMKKMRLMMEECIRNN